MKKLNAIPRVGLIHKYINGQDVIPFSKKNVGAYS